MNVVTEAVSLIKSKRLINKEFKEFFKDVEVEYWEAHMFNIL